MRNRQALRGPRCRRRGLLPSTKGKKNPFVDDGGKSASTGSSERLAVESHPNITPRTPSIWHPARLQLPPKLPGGGIPAVTRRSLHQASSRILSWLAGVLPHTTPSHPNHVWQPATIPLVSSLSLSACIHGRAALCCSATPHSPELGPAMI